MAVALKVEGPLDLRKVPILNFVVQSQSSAPATPVDGQFWWDSTNHQLFYYVASSSTWYRSIDTRTTTMPPSAHTHPASEVSSGTLDVARLGSTVAIGDYLKAVATSGAADWVAPSQIKTDLALTKGDVGLSNVPNVDTTNASNITTGTLPTSVLPPLAINEVFTVASQAAMLALSAQRGDMAIRTDTGKTYVLSSDSPSTLADWKEVMATGQVVSVAGKTGVVTLVKADVGLDQVDNTSDLNKPLSTAATNALAGKAASSHSHAIGDLPVAPSGTSNTTQVVRADDTRLSNARTPVTHTHVATTDLTATGTKDASTFLRGDNTWGVPAGASGGTAAGTTFTPAGGIAATNVQAALAEVDSEKAATTHGHGLADAAITGVLPTAKGGLGGASPAVTQGGVPYGRSVNWVDWSAAGTAGQVLLSGGLAAPTWTTLTAASLGAAATSHLHDDRYYTESEIDGALNTYLTAARDRTYHTGTQLKATISDFAHTHSAATELTGIIANAVLPYQLRTNRRDTAINLNTGPEATSSGTWIAAPGSTNTPEGSGASALWWKGWTISADESQSNLWVTQFAIQMTSVGSGESRMHIRRCQGGAWGIWKPWAFTVEENDVRYAYKESTVNLAGAQTINGGKIFSAAISLAEQTDPGTVVAGTAKFYAKADGFPYWKGDDGVERALITPVSAVHENPGFEGTYILGGNYQSNVVGYFPPGWGSYWTDTGCTASEVAALTEGSKAVKMSKVAGERQGRIHSATEFVVRPGDTVTFEADVKGSGTVGTGTAHMTIQTAPTAGQADFFGAGVQQQTISLAYDTTVKRIKGSFVIPPTHIACRFDLNNTVTGHGAGDITWDNSASSVTTPAVGIDTLEWISLGLSGDYTVPAGSWGTIPFTTKYAGNGTGNGTGQIVIGTPGVYHLIFQAEHTRSGVGFVNYVLRHVRGGSLLTQKETVESGDGWHSGVIAADYQALAGDIFEVQANSQYTGLALQTNRSQFTAHKLAGPGPQGDIGPTGATGYTDISVKCVAWTASFNPLTAAPSTVDGVALAVGNRVLKANTAGLLNATDGVYTVTTVGTGANGVWARATDVDTAAEAYALDLKVEQGTVWGGTRWSSSLRLTEPLGGIPVRWFCYAGDTGWINMPFAAGWSNYGGSWDTGQYRRYNGVVYLKGLIKGGTGTIFTLPAGFRPYGDQHVITSGGAAFAQLNILVVGTVSLNAGVATGYLTMQVPPFIADN